MGDFLFFSFLFVFVFVFRVVVVVLFVGHSLFVFFFLYFGRVPKIGNSRQKEPKRSQLEESKESGKERGRRRECMLMRMHYKPLIAVLLCNYLYSLIVLLLCDSGPAITVIACSSCLSSCVPFCCVEKSIKVPCAWCVRAGSV